MSEFVIRYDEQRAQLDATGEAFFPRELLPPCGPAAFRSAAYRWGQRKFTRVIVEEVEGGWRARAVAPDGSPLTQPPKPRLRPRPPRHSQRKPPRPPKMPRVKTHLGLCAVCVEEIQVAPDEDGDLLCDVCGEREAVA